MSSGVIGPSSFTVERLKKELTEHGVALPKYPKKELLVELYEQNVGASKGGRIAFDYSDEDDTGVVSAPRKSIGTMSKRRSLTTKVKDDIIVSSSGVIISDLSDQDLVQNLKKLGADVGPVTDTTRAVYEKKLMKLLNADRQQNRFRQKSPKVTLQRLTEQQPRQKLIQYSDEEEMEVGEEEEPGADEEEEEEEDIDISEVLSKPYTGVNRFSNSDFKESVTVQKRYTTDELDHDPLRYRKSMEFTGRPPLSSVGLARDVYSSRPLSSRFTSNTTRVSEHYSSTPKSAYTIRDGLSPSRSSNYLQQGISTSGKKSNKKRGCVFWLLLLLLLLLIGVALIIIFWNVESIYKALPRIPA